MGLGSGGETAHPNARHCQGLSCKSGNKYHYHLLIRRHLF